MLPLLQPGPPIALEVLQHQLPGCAPVLVIFKRAVGVLAYKNGSNAHKTHLIASIGAAAVPR